MKIKILTALGLVLLCAACAKEENTLGSYSGNEIYSGKFVNTKAGADQGSILFKAESLTDEIARVKGLDNIRPLFVSHPGKEELEAKYGLDKWYEADLDGDLSSVSESLASLKEVIAVEFNTVMKADGELQENSCDGASETKASDSYLFNDPHLYLQWGLINNGDKSIATAALSGADVNVKDVWEKLTCGDPDIVIAICDEGVKYTHPDLKDNMWINDDEVPGNGIDDDGNGYVDDVYGANFTSSDPAIFWNRHAHGTHCAGIAAAVNNNGLGIAGVAGGSGKGDGCRIMSCQIMSGGTGSVAPAAKGIKYAADNGASIISCSFGYAADAFSTDNSYCSYAGAELAALRYFEDEANANNSVVKGGIAIFASGNDGKAHSCYPGALAEEISVSAMGPDNLPAYYTNYGPGCNIVAPGGEAYQMPWTTYKALILSTVPNELSSMGIETSSKVNDYGYMQGTSMACPFVSGVTALGLSYAKKLGKTFSLKEFKEMIVTSANDIDDYINYKSKTLSGQSMDLKNYYHKMGTGSIDAWNLMMKIEGIPSIVVQAGSKQYVSINDYFGTSSRNLTYIDVEVSDADKNSLGLTEDPYMEYGKVWLHPTKIGSGKITVKAVGGGYAIGGGDSPTGGMEVSQEISIISRGVKVSDGGWL